MVFHWSLSVSKSSQVSRTLLSILAVLNNAVVWMVSTRLSTSKSSSPFSNPSVTVPNAPITIGIIVTCMFHSFFNPLKKVEVLIIIIIIIYSFRVFYTSVSWWFSTGVWVTPSLLKSPGLFWVFKQISTMLLPGWPRFFHWFPIPRDPSPSPWSFFKRISSKWYYLHPHIPFFFS